MEINKSGLTFHKCHDNKLIIEFDKAKVNNSDELETEEKIMLHNFQQLEHFCHRFEQANKNDNSYRFYTLIKNFCDEKINISEKEFSCYKIYQGNGPDITSTLEYIYEVSIVMSNSQKIFCIDFFNLFNRIYTFRHCMEIFENILCYVSIIDTEGKEKFTQTVSITPHLQYRGAENLFLRYINYDQVLHNASELLHNGYLILYLRIDFPYNIKATLDIFYEESDEYPDDIDLLELSDVKNHICEIYSDLFSTTAKIPVTGYKLLVKDFTDDFSFVDTNSLLKELCTADDNLPYVVQKIASVNLCIKIIRRFTYHNALSLPDLETKFNDSEMEKLKEDYKIYGKFFCNLISRNLFIREKKDDLLFKFDHIHYLFNEFLECENPIIPKQNCRPFNSNYEEIGNWEENWKFSSDFIINDEGELILKLDSELGKVLCEISVVFKNMLEFPVVETLTQTATIKEQFLEPFKNIYHLSKGASCIKGSTIHDIISLYKASDYLDIPPLLKFCRELFQKHICVSNVESIKELSESCIWDDDLKNMITSFENDCEKFYKLVQRDEIPLKIPWSLKNNHYLFYQCNKF